METPKRSPAKPQVSLGFLLLMMLIFAMMSAAMLYASRVEAVREEIAILTGQKLNASADGNGRLPHLVFILFTLTSPLLLAGMMSTCVSLLRWWGNRR